MKEMERKEGRMMIWVGKEGGERVNERNKDKGRNMVGEQMRGIERKKERKKMGK